MKQRFSWICRYEAGDHVAVYPVNDPELVDYLEKRLEADLGQIFSLNNIDGKKFINNDI